MSHDKVIGHEPVWKAYSLLPAQRVLAGIRTPLDSQEARAVRLARRLAPLDGGKGLPRVSCAADARLDHPQAGRVF